MFRFGRYFKRYINISKVIFKYGFGGFFRNFHPAFILARIGIKKKYERVTFPERVRMALEELGPTFIKIGQIASSRTDILPPEFTEELSKLQDEVKPVRFEEVEKVIKKELGDINRIFEDFNPNPIGSASIAQVYLAKYKGKYVIVKVRRPNVENIIEQDLFILKILFRAIERNIPFLKGRNLDKILETFERTILKELDFIIEANNVERFRELFKDDKEIYIPKIYPEITTKSVLVQEYIDGIKIDEIEKLRERGINLKKIAENGARLYMKQILIFGFFHADPHPGNIFVRDDGTLVPIDFGMIGRISIQMKRNIQEFIIGMVERDSERLVRALLKIGLFDVKIDKESIKEDILYILDKFEGRKLQDITVKDFLTDIMKVVRKYDIRIPEDLLYLGKTISQIESIGKKLDPEFNAIEFIRRFARENRLTFISIKETFKEKKWWFIDMFNMIMELPDTMKIMEEKLNKFIDSASFKRENDKKIYKIFSAFGIMSISMFLFYFFKTPEIKILSISGLILSSIIFIIEVFKR